MSWSYSGNPDYSVKDRVRFLIGDTDDSEQLLTDQEIDYLIGENSSIYGACAEACETIVAQYSKRSDIGLGGGLDSNLSQKVEHYRELAKEFSSKATAASATLFDGSGTPKFKRGMFDK